MQRQEHWDKGKIWCSIQPVIIAQGQVCAVLADTCLWLEAGDILVVAAGGIGRRCWREEAGAAALYPTAYRMPPTHPETAEAPPWRRKLTRAGWAFWTNQEARKRPERTVAEASAVEKGQTD